MPIDLDSEQILSISAATKAVPKVGRKRPAISTVWRWCRKGVRGVHLEHAFLGGRLVTSREAISRFANRLAEVDRVDSKSIPDHEPRQRSQRQRRKAIERAEQELSKSGI